MAKKSFGIKNFFFSFVIVCIVIYIFQNINGAVKTVVAEKGVLENIISAKGIVVKDEEVLTAAAGGTVTFYYKDGDKVNKGLLVGDVNDGGSGGGKKPFYSSRSGIITYKIDGAEDKYKYENVLTLTPSGTVPEELSVRDVSKEPAVSAGDGVCKIISNFDYYIAATLSNEYAKLFSENKYIKTRVLLEGSESEAWGIIKKINYGSEDSVLIIYFDDYFSAIYDKRYVNLQLITDIYEGLKIDTEALCEKDGIQGAYVKDASNIVKFFPVDVLGKDEETAIISEGEYVSEKDRRKISIADNKYETVKLFDKVIIDPDKVYDGQIIN